MLVLKKGAHDLSSKKMPHSVASVSARYSHKLLAPSSVDEEEKAFLTEVAVSSLQELQDKQQKYEAEERVPCDRRRVVQQANGGRCRQAALNSNKLSERVQCLIVCSLT